MFIVEDFEDEPPVLDITGTWVRTNATAGSGSWSMRSAPIDHNETSDMVVQVPVGATHLIFDIRLSTEGGGYDPFELRGVGEFGELLIDNAWGELSWYRWTYAVEVSSFTSVIFRYTRDNIDGGGLDAVFVDNLTFAAAVPERPPAVANNFDHGTDEQLLVPEDSGGLNGLAFDYYFGEPRYTSELARFPGALAIDCGTPDYGQGFFGWEGPEQLAGATTVYARFYWCMVGAIGEDEMYTVLAIDSLSDWLIGLWTTASDELRLDFAGQAGPTLVGLPADQWIRVEVCLTMDGSLSGHAEAWVFYDPDSTIADQHVVTSTATFGGLPYKYDFGVQLDSTGHTLIDDIALGTTMIGPAGLPSTGAIDAVVAPETAMGLYRLTRGSIAPVTGVDTARLISGGKQGLLVPPVGVETAITLGAAKGRVAGAAVAADLARPLIAAKVVTLGAATEDNQALRLFSDRRLGLARDQSQARPLMRIKARGIGAVTEHGIPAALHPGRGRVLGPAVTSETGTSLRWTKLRAIGPVTGQNVAGVFYPVLPPLQVGLPYRSWGVRTPELLRGVVVDPISSLSLEYLKVFVQHARGNEPVEIAFTAPGVEPGLEDWRPASWAETKKRGAVAQILVGPGGTVTLPDGTYQVWVRTVRADERPVLPSGLIPII
ncbi:hypothetical protein [Nonomuraea cavernae]|uniref:Uncharacterized protein n=1 Tax=Nonomuraea cavernae TaxID=2045107 RepID=A0A918DG58_9ACTN|nr:hypothetical protein [Nonomuraea cavernae]MCA2184650.1 hypothetical protein [Nonomuraea cavernae]GGO63174.1 hypothetical protein GCM10012289_09490 [Nonomuraea cavernae]